MQLHIFELFARTITKLPAQCVLKALDLQCQMLKTDIESKRLPLPDDSFSIFYFREFVRSVKLGQTLHCSKFLPQDHVEFFKETTVRLVQANELPKAAMAQFECAFVNDIT
jgi:hypothetical protein